jgi:hypothetical protein
MISERFQLIICLRYTNFPTVPSAFFTFTTNLFNDVYDIVFCGRFHLVCGYVWCRNYAGCEKSQDNYTNSFSYTHELPSQKIILVT